MYSIEIENKVLIFEQKAIEILRMKSNTDNFHTTLRSRAYSSTGIGFTQRFRKKQFYVQIHDGGYFGGVRVTVEKYGEGLFNYESEQSIIRKNDIWRLQKAFAKGGVFVTCGELKSMLNFNPPNSQK